MNDVNHVSVIAEKAVYERVTTRDFPSIFQAWGGIDNLPNVNYLERIAKHDLMWNCIGLGGGMQWFIKPMGLSESFEPKSIQKGQEIRKQLLRMNPNIILIAEIRYRDASMDWLPEGHKWWMRDEDGQIIKGWEEGSMASGNQVIRGNWALFPTMPPNIRKAHSVIMPWDIRPAVSEAFSSRTFKLP